MSMTEAELRFKIVEFLEEHYNYDNIADLLKDARLVDEFVHVGGRDTPVISASAGVGSLSVTDPQNIAESTGHTAGLKELPQ